MRNSRMLTLTTYKEAVLQLLKSCSPYTPDIEFHSDR